MSVPFTQPQDHLLTLAKTVAELRQRIKCTPAELAVHLKLEKQQLYLIRAWEEARALPSRRIMDLLHSLALKHEYRDLAENVAKAQAEITWRSSNRRQPTPGVDHAVKLSGRESGLLEALQVISDRAAEIRKDQHCFDEMIGRGMCVADIVAHEMDMLKGSIRAVPVHMPSRQQPEHHARRHHA